MVFLCAPLFGAVGRALAVGGVPPPVPNPPTCMSRVN
eukprot:gene45814-53871_t